MTAEHAASPFPERVATMVRQLMNRFDTDVSTIRVGLGLDTVTLVYYAACEALSLDRTVLMERAATLDAQPTDGDATAHAERRYFGSILEGFYRNSSTYMYAAHYSQADADARALDGLRQAYAERTYRLALFNEYANEYPGMLNNPAFNASVSLVAALAYQGCLELSTAGPVATAA